MAPDRQPQFPGGNQAWLAFLNTHLRPPQDLESGEKRVVNIRFFVDVDGTIANFQVARSGGNVFDNEVIRVLKKMPKWVPTAAPSSAAAAPSPMRRPSSGRQAWRPCRLHARPGDGAAPAGARARQQEDRADLLDGRRRQPRRARRGDRSRLDHPESFARQAMLVLDAHRRCRPAISASASPTPPMCRSWRAT